MNSSFASWLRAISAAFVLLTATPSFAANITFCLKFPYSFLDQGMGEDGLLHTSADGTFGASQASYALGTIKQPGGSASTWWLSASGCFNPVPEQNGTYTFTLRPTFNKSNGAKFNVFRDEDKVLETFTWNWTLPVLRGGDYTISLSLGPWGGDPVSNASAVAAQILREGDVGLVSTTYEIIADADATVANATGMTAILTTDQGVKDASWKYVVAHEVGHTIMRGLMGDTLDFDYNADGDGDGLATPGEPQPDANVPRLCTSEKVTGAAKAHCMQSREMPAAAENEAFGHFVALDTMNNDGHADATFVYYKEFWWNTAQTAQVPPLSLDGRTPYTWMENKCNPGASDRGRGTELDWMQFYFEVHTKTANSFSYSRLNDVYRTACGLGSCAGANKSPNWGNTNNAAIALYGVDSDRANHWLNTGVRFGVDH